MKICTDENALNQGQDGYPGAIGGGGYVAPMMVRLAWHSGGTYSCPAKNGGSDGATMRFMPEAGHGANAGLANARNLIEPVKKKYPGASYADLYVLAGNVAIEAMGGPAIPFRPGRSDAPGPATPEEDSRFSPDGRLPGADQGGFPETASHIRDVFYRMGFTDGEIVALLGAHSVGFCHTDRSGYWGPWSRSPNTFSNEYFRLLVEEKWTLKKTHKGQPWTGPVQFESADGALMMTPADMCMVKDPQFQQWTLKYKEDEDLFMADFALAFQKLMELGVKFPEPPKPVERKGDNSLALILLGTAAFFGAGGGAK